MSCTMHPFLHPLSFLVTLTLISSFIAPQATAHRPHPINFPTNPGTQPGMPVWAAPSLHKPAMPLRFPGFQEPQHFLPFFPFPGNGMPSMPAGPIFPSLPSGPTFPSLPGPNFPSLPSVPTFPSTPGAPSEPMAPKDLLPSFPDPSDQKDLPPSFPEPSAKLIENAPGTRTIP